MISVDGWLSGLAHLATIDSECIVFLKYQQCPSPARICMRLLCCRLVMSYCLRGMTPDEQDWHEVTCNFILFYFIMSYLPRSTPHQCAALFSLGLLHYIHDNTNIYQYTFSSNTVITWYMYMLTTTYSYTCFSLNIMMVTWPWCRFIEMLTTYNYLIHVCSTYDYLPNVTFNIHYTISCWNALWFRV